MNLNEDDIFRIALSETKSQSINIIENKISHCNNTISDNWRNEILFDCVLDLIHYCLKKGFTLNECVKCCLIQFELINQFDENNNPTNKFVNISSCLDLFKSELINLNRIMNDKKLKDFIDYINITFITQFNLYKYVFTQERENQILNQEKIIYSPPVNLVDTRLNHSKHISLYEYETKLAEVEKKEKNLNEYFKLERDALARQEADLINFFKYDNTNQVVNEDFIKKLIDDISVPVTNLASKTLRLEFEEYKKREQINAEKKLLNKPEDIALTLKPKSGAIKDSKKSKKK